MIRCLQVCPGSMAQWSKAFAKLAAQFVVLVAESGVRIPFKCKNIENRNKKKLLLDMTLRIRELTVE